MTLRQFHRHMLTECAGYTQEQVDAWELKWERRAPGFMRHIERDITAADIMQLLACMQLPLEEIERQRDALLAKMQQKN